LAGGVNLYAYAGNDPISYSDPFGLQCTTQDRSDCPIVKVSGSVGLVPPGFRLFNTRLSVGPKAAVLGSLTFGTAGVRPQIGVEGGVEAEARLGPATVGATATCSRMLGASSAECSASGSVGNEHTAATANTDGEVGVGIHGAVVSGEVTVNPRNAIIVFIGRTADLLRDFMGSYGSIITGPRP